MDYPLYLFYLRMLIELPDISKWNAKNIQNINYIFSECKNLVFFPAISKWDNIKLNLENGEFSLIYLSSDKEIKLSSVNNASSLIYSNLDSETSQSIKFEEKQNQTDFMNEIFSEGKEDFEEQNNFYDNFYN